MVTTTTQKPARTAARHVTLRAIGSVGPSGPPTTSRRIPPGYPALQLRTTAGERAVGPAVQGMVEAEDRERRRVRSRQARGPRIEDVVAPRRGPAGTERLPGDTLVKTAGILPKPADYRGGIDRAKGGVCTATSSAASASRGARQQLDEGIAWADRRIVFWRRPTEKVTQAT